MAAPNTKGWSARENAHGHGCQLIVNGQVEVSNLNKEPHLAKIGSKDPKVLALELTITGSGDGPDVMAWKGASHVEDVQHDQYDVVSIRSADGPEIARIDVVDDHEHHSAMDEQHAANAEAAKGMKPPKGKAPKKPAAKKPAAAKPAAPKPAAPAAPKPAAKKAAPQKKAAKKAAKKAGKKTAKKAAKKTAKKTAKKYAKKSAKKAAKKSTLKKLVKKWVKKLTPAKKKKKKR